MAWFVSTFLPIHVITHAIYSAIFIILVGILVILVGILVILVGILVILPYILVNKLTQHLVSYQSSAESCLVI
jgi:hypothetical protein